MVKWKERHQSFIMTQRRSLWEDEIYWFTTVDTENKKEEPLKLKGVSLTTDLVECFYYEAKYVKRRKYADGILCCQHDEGLNWRESNTLRMEAMKIERNNITESDLML